ncbi:MAG: polysaccharide biosynthesis/export family protein, partial [Pirellulales bacterium]
LRRRPDGRKLHRRPAGGPRDTLDFVSSCPVAASMPYRSCRLQLVGLLLFAVVASGCHFAYPGREPNGPKPCVPPDVPRELYKTVLPEYIIEPPDLLSIDAISLIPSQSYRLRPLDAITVVTTGNIPPEYHLSGQYLVQPNGTIQLMTASGEVPFDMNLSPIKAAGLTPDELQREIYARLAEPTGAFKLDLKPNAYISIARTAAQQLITGEHLVAPDGYVNLGMYGRVSIVGLTIDEATRAIEAHLAQFDFEDPQVAIDILGFNSKVFYVVTQGAGFGDQVAILPARGNETVLDAIGQIQGLTSNQSTRMWIARPGRNNCNGDQILPVDWVAVTQRGDSTTNYQILPGDRLFVSEDKLVAVDTRLGKIIAPFERIMGFTSLGVSTVSSIKFFNQQGGSGGGGGGP